MKRAILLWWWLRQLKSTDCDTASKAANRLGELRDNRAVEPLLEAEGKRYEYPIREAAMEALGKIGDRRGVAEAD